MLMLKKNYNYPQRQRGCDWGDLSGSWDSLRSALSSYGNIIKLLHIWQNDVLLWTRMIQMMRSGGWRQTYHREEKVWLPAATASFKTAVDYGACFSAVWRSGGGGGGGDNCLLWSSDGFIVEETGSDDLRTKETSQMYRTTQHTAGWPPYHVVLTCHLYLDNDIWLKAVSHQWDVKMRKQKKKNMHAHFLHDNYYPSFQSLGRAAFETSR